MEKIGDIIEDPSTPLLELRNICFMVNISSDAWVHVHKKCQEKFQIRLVI